MLYPGPLFSIQLPRCGIERDGFRVLSVLQFSLLPFQGAFTPSVYQSNHKYQNKYQHLKQGKQSKLLVLHGPGIKEDRLYVKDDKGNKRQIGKYAMGFGRKYDSQIITSTCLDNDSRETE